MPGDVACSGKTWLSHTNSWHDVTVDNDVQNSNVSAVESGEDIATVVASKVGLKDGADSQNSPDENIKNYATEIVPRDVESAKTNKNDAALKYTSRKDDCYSNRAYNGSYSISERDAPEINDNTSNLSREERSSVNSSVPVVQHNRDWVFISIVTLIVSVLDKVFDVQFLVTLTRQSEWDFFAVSLVFVVGSTVLSSLFAAQSFWLQSSQLPTWGKTWVKKVYVRKTVSKSDFLTRPIHQRVLPQSSAFAVRLQDDRVDERQDSGCREAWTVKDNSRDKACREIENLSATSDRKIRNYQVITNDVSNNNMTSDNTAKTPSLLGRNVKGRIAESTINSTSEDFEKITSAPVTDCNELQERRENSNDNTAGRDSVDCKEELLTNQQFRGWVKYVIIALASTGLLPELVLLCHLVLYWTAGRKRPIVGCILRDTWYVQTLKLTEALLESIPQIHTKVYYFLTIEAGNANVFTSGGNAMGLLVNGVSICIGLVAILNVPIKFKVLTFVLLAINLATRISACALLDQSTWDGVYFIPLGCAFTVSVAAMAAVTLLKHGDYKRNLTKFEKYVGLPIMRTFCLPPTDVSGVAVAAVFVAAAVTSVVYSDGCAWPAVVVGGSVVGQLMPALAWIAAGVWQEHEHNKKQAAVVHNYLEILENADKNKI